MTKLTSMKSNSRKWQEKSWRLCWINISEINQLINAKKKNNIFRVVWMFYCTLFCIYNYHTAYLLVMMRCNRLELAKIVHFNIYDCTFIQIIQIVPQQTATVDISKSFATIYTELSNVKYRSTNCIHNLA